MSMKVFFGVPGSGKSTHAAFVAYSYILKGIPVYSNVDILGTFRINVEDIGRTSITDGVLIIDEAGIDFNNRLVMQKSSRQMSQDAIKWFKLYRHYGITDIYIYSQSYEDFDITLRRLADELYLVKRSALPNIINVRRIFMKLGIDETTKQIQEQYFFRIFSTRKIYAPKYWGLFDSWSAPPLEEKDFWLTGYGDLSPKDFRTIAMKPLKRVVRHRIKEFRKERFIKPFLKIQRILKNSLHKTLPKEA